MNLTNVANEHTFYMSIERIILSNLVQKDEYWQDIAISKRRILSQ